MLSMDFIREQPDVVRGAISVKGVTVDLEANAISAGFQSAAPEERAALGAKAKAAGAKAGELETALAEKDAALKQMLLQLPGIPWGGRAGRTD